MSEICGKRKQQVKNMTSAVFHTFFFFFLTHSMFSVSFPYSFIIILSHLFLQGTAAVELLLICRWCTWPCSFLSMVYWCRENFTFISATWPSACTRTTQQMLTSHKGSNENKIIKLLFPFDCMNFRSAYIHSKLETNTLDTRTALNKISFKKCCHARCVSVHLGRCLPWWFMFRFCICRPIKWLWRLSWGNNFFFFYKLHLLGGGGGGTVWIKWDLLYCLMWDDNLSKLKLRPLICASSAVIFICSLLIIIIISCRCLVYNSHSVFVLSSKFFVLLVVAGPFVCECFRQLFL